MTPRWRAQAEGGGASGGLGVVGERGRGRRSRAWMGLGQSLALAVAVLANAYIVSPRQHLGVGETLATGQYITSCSILERWAADCRQHYLVMQLSGELGLFKGESPGDPGSFLVWQSGKSKRAGKLDAVG
jgi:hypothetical protein